MEGRDPADDGMEQLVVGDLYWHETWQLGKPVPTPEPAAATMPFCETRSVGVASAFTCLAASCGQPPSS